MRLEVATAVAILGTREPVTVKMRRMPDRKPSPEEITRYLKQVAPHNDSEDAILDAQFPEIAPPASTPSSKVENPSPEAEPSIQFEDRADDGSL